MATISKTRVATSDPLNLCDHGLDIFGDGWTSKKSARKHHTIFDKSVKILAWKGEFWLRAGYFFGVCGPSFVFGVDLEGSHDSNSFSLEATNDTLEAGFFMGANISLSMGARLEESVADHWYTPWKRHWKTKAHFSYEHTFDVLSILFDVLAKALKEKNPFHKIASFMSELLGSWGFSDSVSNKLAEGRGHSTAHPSVSAPVDILPLIPYVDEVDRGLRKLHIELSTGPNLGVEVPVRLAVDSLKLDQAEFSNLSWSDGRVNGSGRAVDDNVETITLGLEQSPGLDFTLGWFGEIKFWKLFDISRSVDFAILSALGIEIRLGTYHYNLEGTVGQASLAGVEVIFEEPEARPA